MPAKAILLLETAELEGRTSITSITSNITKGFELIGLYSLNKDISEKHKFSTIRETIQKNGNVREAMESTVNKNSKCFYPIRFATDEY